MSQGVLGRQRFLEGKLVVLPLFQNLLWFAAVYGTAISHRPPILISPRLEPK